MLLLLFLNITAIYSQDARVEPQFKNCENKDIAEARTCFDQQIQEFVYKNFQVPEVVVQNQFKGVINVLFEVDTVGVFIVRYVDAVYPELAEESKRVFAMLPKVKPAVQNGKPAFAKFNLKIAIPLENPQ